MASSVGDVLGNLAPSPSEASNRRRTSMHVAGPESRRWLRSWPQSLQWAKTSTPGAATTDRRATSRICSVRAKSRLSPLQRRWGVQRLCSSYRRVPLRRSASYRRHGEIRARTRQRFLNAGDYGNRHHCGDVIAFVEAQQPRCSSSVAGKISPAFLIRGHIMEPPSATPIKNRIQAQYDPPS